MNKRLLELISTPQQRGVLYDASQMSSIDEIRETLRPYYKDLVQFYEDELLALNEDFRSGSETYGYDDLGSIQRNLLYICDRWMVAFRARWLIDLISPDYQLYGGVNPTTTPAPSPQPEQADRR